MKNSASLKKSALSIEYWPVFRLKPYEKNPRKNDRAVDRMVLSIKEFGFSVPVLAQSSGTVVDGHLRLKAALKIGMDQVPVIPCDGWTEAQVKAFRLMVNRSVTWAEFDFDLLAGEMADLKALDFDLSMTGFDSREIDALFCTTNAAEDDVPRVPDVPITKQGDLWQLGPHRLLCGDATKLEDVARVLSGARPFLMVTDPPYGVDYEPEWRNDAAAKGQLSYAASSIGKVGNDDRCDWSAAWIHFPGNVAYVWHASLHTSEVIESLHASGFEHRANIIWAKSAPVISRGHYHWQHEPCWYVVRKGCGASWHGDRSQSTIWNVVTIDGDRSGHSTQKPVEIMRRPILNHTAIGDSVYDPFLGSGTTLVAAELTGRICFGMEIDPAYCDVICARWEKLTGRKATLESA